MAGSIEHVLAAAIFFVGTHFALAMTPVRPWLAARLGENGFLGFYSAVAILGLVWLGFAYRQAPYVELWPLTRPALWLALAAMPVAVFLVVAGLSTPSPTGVGGERAFDQTNPARGILTITRHPVMSGIALWAATHVLANGDAGSVILFGALLALAVGGMVHIDAKKRDRMGAAWGPFAMTTSVVPFQAIFEGRATFDAAGIGWRRVIVAVVLFAFLVWAHPWISGVALIVR